MSVHLSSEKLTNGIISVIKAYERFEDSITSACKRMLKYEGENKLIDNIIGGFAQIQKHYNDKIGPVFKVLYENAMGFSEVAEKLEKDSEVEVGNVQSIDTAKADFSSIFGK